MLSRKVGVTLAEMREMSVEDYFTYMAVFDAEAKLSHSIIKRTHG